MEYDCFLLMPCNDLVWMMFAGNGIKGIGDSQRNGRWRAKRRTIRPGLTVPNMGIQDVFPEMPRRRDYDR